MRMILNNEELESGKIRQRPFLRLGYLPQELESLPGNTILDATHRNQFPDHEAKRILAGLGFRETDWERKINTLSGGYRMRVALAHLLLSAPDVLMLDEPTNHLDKPTQRWLESFLLSSNFTLLIISHDIGFLDNMVTHIWEVRNHTLQEYRGNYTRFQKLRRNGTHRKKPPPIDNPKKLPVSKILSTGSDTRPTKPARCSPASNNLKK